VKIKVLLFGFHDINTKNASLRNPVEKLLDCRVSWPKERANQKICRKIGKLQFCNLLRVSRADSCHVEINWGAAGHVSISK